MSDEMQTELKSAIRSDASLEDIVALLRRFRDKAVTRDEAYSFLELLITNARDEAEYDRIADISDFVAGFCSPHMKIWDDAPPMKSAC